ncbi:uncharacterized protein DNG_07271 [Cephalotrichum gorgonifer]|uniref:BTB domain-containing protein n=1 Tax=Cephalotrichum gorgonifer TaxID=2041049 RepID=A0AAE8N1C4_9PEZI|nr:uncharacterized protein DNG_07271 [Cephalotrichum gorgonifer]
MPPMIDIEDSTPAEVAPDTEMVDTTAADSSAPTELAVAEAPSEEVAPAAETEVEKVNRATYLSYLSSPIVTLLVRSAADAEPVLLSAHQALLSKSPYFRDALAAFAAFAEDGSAARQIDLGEENIDAVGCFLEYLYTGDYFPKKLPGQRVLEPDPALETTVDEDGAQLLRHARVYTLASKFGLPDLKVLATSKIHCVDSTAGGEIAYARYVYGHTTADDRSVRAPVAQFWATRSHVLRSEAEDEFRGLCLEFPQFGYDVLTRVLDEKVRRDSRERMQPHGSARKRARQSQG